MPAFSLSLLATTASLLAPQQQSTPLVRCGCDHHAPISPFTGAAFLGPTSCGANFNVDNPMFDPANRPLYRVPLVFHLIGTDTTPSAVTPARIDTQMQILNGTFQPAQIEFYVADVRRYNNSNWTQDIGDYWTSNSIDPQRNVNVYVLNSVGVYLGYVPDLPFAPGFVGSAADRIVVRDLTVGFDTLPPTSNLAQYDEGRTLVHELGHYFGLYHTFETALDAALCPGSTALSPDCACLSASRTLTGDLLTDTEFSRRGQTCDAFFIGGSIQCSYPTGGSFVDCHQATALASVCPTVPGAQVEWDNVMSYSSDRCAMRFTPEQVRRMHCTMDTYRSLIGTPAGPVGVKPYCDVVMNSTGRIATLAPTDQSSTGVLANNLRIVGADLPALQFFLPIMARGQDYFPGFYPGSPGVLCLGGVFARLNSQLGVSSPGGAIGFDVDLTAIPEGTGLVAAIAGEVWNVQVWFRDGAISNTTKALTIPIR